MLIHLGSEIMNINKGDVYKNPSTHVYYKVIDIIIHKSKKYVKCEVSMCNDSNFGFARHLSLSSLRKLKVIK